MAAWAGFSDEELRKVKQISTKGDNKIKQSNEIYSTGYIFSDTTMQKPLVVMSNCSLLCLPCSGRGKICIYRYILVLLITAVLIV